MDRFRTLTTAHIADACVRQGIPLRVAPPGLVGVSPGDRCAGRARPVRHAGSVDIYLEALESAEPGDVLVVDNAGRTDEACVGDLVALEVREAGLAGILIWGLHRDTADIRAIGLPVFSLGATPPGPTRVDERAPDALTAATIGAVTVTSADAVFADDDGALVVALDRVDEVLTTAEGIRDTERAQAERIAGGISLRQQVRFSSYLEARRSDGSLTFRQHLRMVGGEIEV
ncbi:RraA family protein [Schumannella luteola]